MTSGPPEDEAEQLKEKIEQTREQLGRTAEQLAAKADVKARAQAQLTDLGQRAKGTASQLRREAAVRAGAGKYRIPLVIAVGVLVVGAVVARRWTRR